MRPDEDEFPRRDDYRSRLGAASASEPGTPDRVAVMAARYEAGQSLWNETDGPEEKSGKEPVSQICDTGEFSRRLHLARVRKCVSVPALAAMCGLSRWAIYRLERGEHDPTLTTIIALSQALGCTPADLVGGPPPPPQVVLQICRRCKRQLPADRENFPPDEDAPAGIRAWCRQCDRERHRRGKDTEAA